MTFGGLALPESLTVFSIDGLTAFRAMPDGPLLAKTLPELAAELDRLLRRQGHPELAEQLPVLRIAAVCSCEVEGCASFYTARPLRRWFRRGRQIPAGDMVVDTIDGEIVFVEVLGRPDVREALRRPAGGRSESASE